MFLLKFLYYIVALNPKEIAMIPPALIMLKFIGGQTLWERETGISHIRVLYCGHRHFPRI